MLCTSTMYIDRRLMAALGCAGSLVAAHASAQSGPAPAAPAPVAPAPAPVAAVPAPAPVAAVPAPAPAGAEPAAPAPAPPDTLETPYSDAPPVAPPPHPVSPGKAQKMEFVLPAPPKADSRLPAPIRGRRRLALLGELGWNGLAGFGPILTYHGLPHWSVDFGAGFSLLGAKVGVRGRYNFLTTPFTPFVGFGYNYGSGFGQFTTDPSSDPNGDPNREPVTIDHGPSHLIHGVVGFDFIHRHGFTMLGTLGYAWLLNRDNYRVLAGKLTPDEEKGFNIAFKGGLVIGVAFGYAFETQ